MNIFSWVGKLFNEKPIAEDFSFPVSQKRDKRAFLRAFSENEWLYSAVSLIADEVSNTALKIFTKGSDKNGNKVEVDTHDFLELLKNPNSVQTGKEFLEYVQSHLDLLGDAYIYVVRNLDKDGVATKEPVELWALDPDKMEVKWASTGDVEFYKYTNGANTLIFSPKEIVHMRQQNPESIYFGQSPAQAAAKTIDADINTAEWVKNFFFNSAIPNLLITAKKMGDNGIELLKTFFGKKHKGVMNAHRNAFLDGDDIKVQQLNASLKDLDVTAQGNYFRDKILSSYRVPKTLVGISEDVNRATIESSIFIFRSFTIKPRVQKMVQALGLILAMFDDGDRLVLEAENVVPEDEELKLKKIDSGLVNGWMTPNEARQMQGLDPMEGGDKIFMALGKLPINSTSTTGKSLPAPKKKGFSEEQRRAVDKAFVQRHTIWSKKFEDVMTELFSKQEDKVLDILPKIAERKIKQLDDGVLLDQSFWDEIFIEVTTPLYQGMTVSGGQSGINLTGLDRTFNPLTQNVINSISDMSVRMSTEVNATTLSQLKTALAEGLKEGEGTAKLGGRVKELFDGYKTWRAERIARTESTKALNNGAVQGYDQVGVEKKEWLTTLDDRTREGHLIADGQVVGLEEFFNVDGELLSYPSDAAGSGGNVINCRCTVLPVVD